MQIDIVGSTKHPPEAIIDACEFYGKYLLSPRLYSKIDVAIQFRRPKPGVEEAAYCEYVDTNFRPRDFLITLPSRYILKSTLLYLAHEVIHLKQYATSQLYDYDRLENVYRWNGERIDTTNLTYWELPWEIEARGLEHVLYYKFRESKLKGIE